MGFCGDREKALAPSEEQKWSYIVSSSRPCHRELGS